MIGKLKVHLKDKGITLVYNDDVLKLIAEKSFSEKFGARNMRRYIERHVEDKLATLLIDNYANTISGISMRVDNDDITIDFI